MGPEELALLEESGWTRWPARLPEQPVFYPVLNRDYAIRIARDWNVRHSGAGYVTEFDVRAHYLDRFEVHQVGGRTILEYWIPAERLEEFNRNVVGEIRVVDRFLADGTASWLAVSGEVLGVGPQRLAGSPLAE